MLIKELAKAFGLKEKQVEDTVALIDEGNTIPFIARYRKEITGGIDDGTLRDLKEKLDYLRNLEARKQEVLRLIEEQGKLTDSLSSDIRESTVLQRVEDLYRPFKKKRQTRATKAREAGLEPLADQLMKGRGFDAKPFVDPKKGIATVEEALAGARDIIAELVADDPDVRSTLRKRALNQGVLVSEAKKKNEASVYEGYYDFSERVSALPNHRILAINRGEREGFLKVSLGVDDGRNIDLLEKRFNPPGDVHCRRERESAIADGYKRLIFPAIEREVRAELTERAETDAIDVFKRNLKALLLIPPVKGARVLGIDPSFRTGCKCVTLTPDGDLLDVVTIYPNAPQHDVAGAKKKLLAMIENQHTELIAIGNGTASRETERFVADVIKEVDWSVHYTIVSEAGASVYSASDIARQEFPELDVSIRGAISIGRRLQDPLAELVKIDPKHIGVGQYQHDLNQGRLDTGLGDVVEDAVNSVGVELNAASGALLGHVSGISPVIAENILAHRRAIGGFSSRKELLKVKRLGPKTYEQAAGFLRIVGGANPLDRTAVHPESYTACERFLDHIGLGIDDRSLFDERIKDKGGLAAVAKAVDIGLPTLKDMIAELKKPGRDPRDEMPRPTFKTDVLSLDDLEEGLILTGTVRNVVDFGAFVDIGVKNDGLVHISQLANRFVKNPYDVVSVGDEVEVKILTIDRDRGKIGLSMKAV